MDLIALGIIFSTIVLLFLGYYIMEWIDEHLGFGRSVLFITTWIILLACALAKICMYIDKVNGIIY